MWKASLEHTPRLCHLFAIASSSSVLKRKRKEKELCIEYHHYLKFYIDYIIQKTSFFSIEVWCFQKESGNTSTKHSAVLKSATCLLVPPGLPHQYPAPLPLRFPLRPTLIQSPSLQTRTKPPIVQPQTLNRHLIANNRIEGAEANLRRCDCVGG